jgi:hypothetical protein
MVIFKKKLLEKLMTLQVWIVLATKFIKNFTFCFLVSVFGPILRQAHNVNFYFSFLNGNIINQFRFTSADAVQKRLQSSNYS